MVRIFEKNHEDDRLAFRFERFGDPKVSKLQRFGGPGPPKIGRKNPTFSCIYAQRFMILPLQKARIRQNGTSATFDTKHLSKPLANNEGQPPMDCHWQRNNPLLQISQKHPTGFYAYIAFNSFFLVPFIGLFCQHLGPGIFIKQK